MSGSLDPHVYPPVNHQLKLREGIPPQDGSQALWIAKVLVPPLFPFVPPSQP